ncbi:MAG: hypothetical protein ACKPA7_17020 [Sphaerospermopsis kisseleviana]
MVIFKNLPQSPVTSPQSPVTSHQSPVTSPQRCTELVEVSPVPSHSRLSTGRRTTENRREIGD